jgi:tetratricopeptide (TPR) repeat protein
MPKQQAQRKAKKLKTKDHGPLPLSKSVFFRRTMLEVLITLFLIVAILAVFWPVKNFRFLNLDDEGYVTDNPQVLNGLSFKGVIWAFTTIHSSNWHPLTWLSHMLDIELYGLNPGGHHLTNLLFHIANILLLFFILKQMTGAPWRSGFVAALFALHPLHVESVAWVAERKDVLSTFFWMLTIGAYVHYVHQTSLRRYLLVFLSFTLGLMSKPMLVTLPFVLLLLDYWPLGRFQMASSRDIRISHIKTWSNSANGMPVLLRLVWEKVPLFVLVIASCLLTVMAQQKGGAVASLEALSLEIRMANALISYISYIGKMIWPSRLAIQYPYPERVLLWQVAGAGLFLLGVSVLVIRELRRRPYLLVGWLWYLGTLVPVIGLVQVGSQAMADRYTYVPLIGLFIIMIWGISDLSAGWRHKRILLPASAVLLVSILSILTRIQLQHWYNGVTLFRHSLDVTINNYLSHNGYGVALAAQGKNEEAVAHYKEALRIKPYFADTHSNLGNALVRQGKYQEAIDHFTKALRLRPDFAKAHNGLGVALARQGKYEQAMTHYEEALRIKSDYAEARNNLGITLAQQGKIQEAIIQYLQALQIKPAYADAHYNLGNLLARQGKFQEAITHFIEVTKIKPGDAEVHYNIGAAFTEQGKPREAIYHYSQALRIKPDFAQARFSLGLAYWMIGDRGSALEELRILKMNNPDLASTLSQKFLK